MVFRLNYKSDSLIFAGGQLCDNCCPADIVVTGFVIAGLSSAGAVQWNSGGGNDIVKTDSTIYAATNTGVRRYTLSGAYIDTLTALTCNGIDVDLSGNVYIAHNRSGGVSVTKVNSAGVTQWTYDTGGNALAIKLNRTESKVAAVGDRADNGGGDKTLWVLATSNGAAQWTFHPSTPWLLVSVDWDAFGNVYVVNPQGFTGLTKISTAPAIVWQWNMCTEAVGPCSDFNTYAHVTTDSINVYLTIDTGSVGIRALTVRGDPASSEGRELWTGAGGIAGTVDADGNLYTVDHSENAHRLDPSDGSTIWTAAAVVSVSLSIHAGTKPTPLPWNCNTTYIIGDLVIHVGTIYQCSANHISCGDEVWQAQNWTIGDRCFYPTQTENNAYRLTNNNKTAGDINTPDTDVDWIEDNDEPGSGNNWTDYWDT